MKTLDELHDEVKNNTKYLEIEKIEDEIRCAMVENKNAIVYNFVYVRKDLIKQKEIISEIEKSGFKVSDGMYDYKNYTNLKIEWDPKIIEDKNPTIISAAEAKELFNQATSEHLFIKEIDIINKEIKEAASQRKNNIWHKWKFIVDRFNIMKQLRELGYDVDDTNVGECIFIEWR